MKHSCLVAELCNFDPELLRKLGGLAPKAPQGLWSLAVRSQGCSSIGSDLKFSNQRGSIAQGSVCASHQAAPGSIYNTAKTFTVVLSS